MHHAGTDEAAVRSGVDGQEQQREDDRGVGECTAWQIVA